MRALIAAPLVLALGVPALALWLLAARARAVPLALIPGTLRQRLGSC